MGPQGVILSSDVGQIFSPTVGDAMREYFTEFRKRGISEDDIVEMSVINTNRLVYEAMA